MPTFTLSATSPITDMSVILAGMQSNTINAFPVLSQLDMTIRLASDSLQVAVNGINLTPNPLPNQGIFFSGTIYSAFFTAFNPTIGYVQTATLTNMVAAFDDLFDNATDLLSGDDTIISTGLTPHTLYGYGGSDVFVVTDGAVRDADTMYGGDGDDAFNIDYVPTGEIAAPNDAIFGGAGTDTLWLNLDRGANFGTLSTVPQSVEVLRITTFGEASELVLAGGLGILGTPGLTQLEAVARIYAVTAGITYDFSGLTWSVGGSAGQINGSAGDDTIIAPSAYLGSADVTISGNLGHDTLTGGSGAETIMGGTGLDRLNGGGGADSLNGEADVDALIGGAGNDTLVGGLGGDGLQGGDDADSLTGDEGADTLNGGAGEDMLSGGVGNDIYVIDSLDTVIELSGNANGIDTLQSTETISLSLYANVENLSLMGTANIDATGSSANNAISGNNGDNELAGGGGSDTLRGFGGDDIYRVTATVSVLETASGGFDTAITRTSHTLADNVEVLVLFGSAAANLTGNDGANRITANDAANTLNGGGGADTLIGFGGSDIYVVDAGDVVLEFAGEGTDTVQSSVNVTLAENVETLVLTGSGAIRGTGNAAANQITGNTGANVLNGGAGNDTLTGGGGEDAFVFDTAAAADNVDRITDFNRATDVIRLDNALFTGLGADGQLAASAFHSNTTGLAGDSTDRIIYETDTGILRYDSNGSAPGGVLVQIAVLTNRPTGIDHTDFLII